MPTSRAQARFKTYSAILEDEEKRRKEQERIYTRETKKVKRAGFGQFLGALVGAMLAPATGGASLALTTGLMAGAGSRLGSEIGERSVGGTSQIGESDYLFGITGEGGIRQANFEMQEREKAFNQQQNVSALTDALSGMMFAGLGGGGKGVSDMGTQKLTPDLVKGVMTQSQAYPTAMATSQLGQGGFLEKLTKYLTQQGQQSLLEQLLQDRQKRTRKPFDFGNNNFSINQ